MEMYCRNCGQRIENHAKVCPVCGSTQSASETDLQSDPDQYAQPQAEDKGGFLWGLLGCCVPIAGLVLYLTWQNQRPKTAKAVLVCAAVGVVRFVLLYVLATVVRVRFSFAMIDRMSAWMD